MTLAAEPADTGRSGPEPPESRSSGWLVPSATTAGWQYATALVAVLFAVQRFATSVFYSHFGVSPEQVGIGYGQSLIEGVVVFVILVVAANVIVLLPAALILVGAWMRSMATAARLRQAISTAPGRTIGYLAHRAAAVGLVIALIILAERVDTWVLVIGLVPGVWGLMWLGSAVRSPFEPAASPPPLTSRERWRRARRVTLVLTAGFTVVYLAAPLFWAGRDAANAKRGLDVSGFPAIAWRAQRVEISWLGQPPAGALAGVERQCLMYLGQADGQVVLFDVSTQRTVWLPTTAVTVRNTGSAGSTCL